MSLQELVAVRPMMKCQYDHAEAMVVDLQPQVEQEYACISSQLETMVLNEMDPTKEDRTLVASTMTFQAEVEPKVSTIHTTLVRNIPAPETAPHPTAPVGGGGAQAKGGAEAGAGRATQERQMLKLKPQEIPRFNGSARTYPGFRKLWRENVESAHTESSQYLYLVSVLSDDVKKRISMVAKDTIQIWEQLDQLYGKPEMLGEMVMQDVCNLKSDSDDFVVKFSILLDETKVLLQHAA